MLKVLSVASEVFPLVKTGGLADVAGALPGALTRESVEMRTLAARLSRGDRQARRGRAGIAYSDAVRRPGDGARGARPAASISSSSTRRICSTGRAILSRPGRPRLARQRPALRRAGARRRRYRQGRRRRLRARCRPRATTGRRRWRRPICITTAARGPATVLTIHNLAFQGHFPACAARAARPAADAMTIDGVEYFGGVGFLKAGLQLADRITTVSPTYAREIMTPEFGHGARRPAARPRAAVVEGIVNGIDDEVWNPETDAHLPQTYSALRLDMRGAQQDGAAAAHGSRDEARRAAVRRRFAPVQPEGARSAARRPADVSSRRAARLGVARHRRRRSIELGFAEAARAYAGAVGCVFGYDETLAHLMQAGSDFLVVPSRFEPCGLTQLCALRYGATPIVARVGGLADTVIDANEAALTAGVATGVQFYPPDAERASAMRSARALGLLSRPADDAPTAAQRHARRRFLARPRQALRRALSRPGGERRVRERTRKAAAPLGIARSRPEGADVARLLRACERRLISACSTRPANMRPRACAADAGDGGVHRGAGRGLARGRALRLSRRRPVRARARPSLRRLQAAGRPLCGCDRPPLPAAPLDVRARRRQRRRSRPNAMRRGAPSGEAGPPARRLGATRSSTN